MSVTLADVTRYRIVPVVVVNDVANAAGLGAALVAGGLFMPAYSTASTVLVQEHVEEWMMGRVFSMHSVSAVESITSTRRFKASR